MIVFGITTIFVNVFKETRVEKKRNEKVRESNREDTNGSKNKRE